MSDSTPPPPPAPDAQPGFGPAPAATPAAAAAADPAAPARGHAATAPGYAPPAPGYGPPAPGYGPPQPGWTPPPAPGVPFGTTGAGQENNRPGLAIVAGIGAMLLLVVVYAAIIDATKHDYTYMALGVGLVLGLVLAKVGGRHPSLPVVALVLALLAIFLGEMAGMALLLHSQEGVGYGTVMSHLGDLFSAWKATRNATGVFFFVIGGVEAFIFTRRFAGAMGNPYQFKRRR